MPTFNFDNADPAHESFRYFHQQFERMVGDYSERVALRFGSRISLKYHELNRESNQLAHYLCSQGVKAGDRVAIFFDKSPLQVIAVLACFKIGAVAIPLETLEELGEEGGQQHWRGEERLKEKFRVTQPKVILTQSKHGPPLVQSLVQCEVQPQCLYLNDLADKIHRQPTDNLGLRLDPGSDPDAYIYFTSGSTGQPKAVLVGASGLLSRLLEAQQNLRITEQDVVGQFCPFDIDASLMEIMMALGSGACLDMIPPHIQSLTARLHEYFNSHGITLVPMVPSLHALLEPSKFRTLRVLITTGEDLTLEQLNRWRQGPSMQIICNGHGPTETTIALTFGIYWDKARGVQSEMVHIGKPLLGTIVCLRDEAGRIVGCEAEGELLIGGIGVAKGYLGQHDLTAEKFVTLAKSALPPSLPGWEQLPAELRFYCTGDRVQFNVNSDMVFKGRVDQQQVKISGKYIEKNEIAAILQRHEDIEKVTCCTELDKVIAVIQLKQGVEGDPSPILRAHLARGMERLPPIQFKFVDSWEERSQSVATADEIASVLQTHERIAKVTCRTEQGEVIAIIQLKHEVEADPRPILHAYLAKSMVELPPIQFDLAGNWKGRSQALVVAAAEDPLLALKVELKAIYETLGICAAADVFDDETFDALGGNSFQATKLLRHLAQRYPLIDVRDQAIFNRQLKVQQLAEYITQCNNPDLRSQRIGSRYSGSKDSLFFMIHSITGDGEADYERAFFHETYFPYQVFAISAPGLKNPDATPDTIELMAAQYLRDIKARQAEGPYLIGGWSLGGIIAHEIGAQLQDQGELVAVVMLDSIAPSYLQQRSEQEYAAHMCWVAEALFRYYFASLVPEETAAWLHSPEFAELDKITQTHQVMDALRLLVSDDSLDLGLRSYLKVYAAKRYRAAVRELTNSIELVRKIALAELGYCPEHSVSCLDLVRAQVQYFPGLDPTLGWGDRIDKIRDVEGDHFAMLEHKQYRQLFRHLQERLDQRSFELKNLKEGKRVDLGQHWNIPQRNDKFTGRQEVLQSLMAELRTHSRSSVKLVLAGMAGVGKTQCAMSLVHNVLQEGLVDPDLTYDFVVWLSGQNWKTDLAHLARHQFDFTAEAYEGMSSFKVVYDKLTKKYSKILFVFDSVENERSIQDFLSLLKSSYRAIHTLITTCSDSWYGIEPIQVKPFDEREALRFVCHQLDGVEVNELPGKFLVRELHYYPLALSQAIVFIKEMLKGREDRVERFLRIYQNHRDEILQKPGIPDDVYHNTVYSAWSVLIQRLEESPKKRPKQSAELLRCCAYFFGQSIPVKLVYQLLSTEKEKVDEFAFTEICQVLREHSLITASVENISMHQLLQTVVRYDNQQVDKRQEAIIIRCLQSLNQLFNYDIADLSTYPSSVYAPHVEALLDHIGDDISEGMQPLLQFRLYHRLASNCLYHQGNEQRAMALWQFCLRQAERYFGAGVSVPIIAECIVAIGKLQTGLCQYTVANDLFIRASSVILALEDQDDEQARLFALHSREYAYWYFYQNDIPMAKAYAQKALDKYQQPDEGAVQFPKDNRRGIAIVKVLFGQIFCAEKQYQDAQEYLQAAKEIFEDLYGEDAKHHYLALIYDAWGMIGMLLGDYQSAAKYFKQGIEVYEDMLGDAVSRRDFATLLDHYAEAQVYCRGSVDDYVEHDARSLFERSLQMKTAVFVAEPHPSIAVTFLKLGCLAIMSKDFDSARSCLQQNLEIWKRLCKLDLHGLDLLDITAVPIHWLVEYVDALLEFAVLDAQQRLSMHFHNARARAKQSSVAAYCQDILGVLSKLDRNGDVVKMMEEVNARIIAMTLKVALYNLQAGCFDEASVCYDEVSSYLDRDLSQTKRVIYKARMAYGVGSINVLRQLFSERFSLRREVIACVVEEFFVNFREWSKVMPVKLRRCLEQRREELLGEAALLLRQDGNHDCAEDVLCGGLDIWRRFQLRPEVDCARQAVQAPLKPFDFPVACVNPEPEFFEFSMEMIHILSNKERSARYAGGAMKLSCLQILMLVEMMLDETVYYKGCLSGCITRELRFIRGRMLKYDLPEDVLLEEIRKQLEAWLGEIGYPVGFKYSVEDVLSFFKCAQHRIKYESQPYLQDWRTVKDMIRKARASRFSDSYYEAIMLYWRLLQYLGRCWGLSREGEYLWSRQKFQSVRFEIKLMFDEHLFDELFCKVAVELLETGIMAAECNKFGKAVSSFKCSEAILRVRSEEDLLPELYFALAAVYCDQSQFAREAKLLNRLGPQFSYSRGFSRYRLFEPDDLRVRKESVSPFAALMLSRWEQELRFY